MPFRVGWVRRPGVTFLTGRKSVFSNGDRHRYCLVIEMCILSWDLIPFQETFMRASHFPKDPLVLEARQA
jgi:hypothetical protein